MTVGSGAASGADEASKASRKPEGGEDEESAAEQQQPSTKRDGEEETLLSSSSAVQPGSAPAGPSSSSSSSPPNPSLGSPPHGQDQHHFLRSSVRPPSKRIRKELSAPAVNGHSGARARGTGGGSSGAGGTSKSAPRNQGPVEKDEGGNQKRARRQWESWSAEDKNSFFEGLYEHGKDFEAIQNNIALKYKKKGKPASIVKNKEQVRHFYYRTWHKISKHIDFNNAYSRVLKKSSQELYGLICYAELRKKVGGLMDDKNVAKLNELIQQGATTVRFKGRNLRIKAPMCRALKKLCDPDGMLSDEEDQKPVRLPLKVAVELQPRSNHSWTRVQSLAHNPRLRMVVELHRKVSSLIEFLKQKWAIQDQRILKSLAEREALAGVTPPGEAEDLFLYPAENSTLIALPGIARVVHSKASCTVHWQESGRGRPGVRDLPAAHILGIQPVRGTGKPGKGVSGCGDSKRVDGQALEGSDGSMSMAAAESNATTPTQNTNAPTSITPSIAPSATSPASSSPCPAPEVSGSATGDSTTGTSQTQMESIERTKETVSPGDSIPTDQSKEESALVGGVTADGAPPSTSEPSGRVEEAAGSGSSTQHIREEGWSSQSSENVTLAELYLMLGKPGKLQLEYEWQPKPRPSVLPTTHRVLHCLLRLVSSEVNPKPVSLSQPPCMKSITRIIIQSFSTGGRNLPRSLLVTGGEGDGGVFAVPTTLPPNSSRHLRMFSPNKEAELAFRQQLDSISSDIFLTKQRKVGRGRPLRKPLVVQRTLLPRTTGDTSQHVCSFSILSNSSATGKYLTMFNYINLLFCNCASGAIDLAAKSAGIIPGSPCRGVEPPALQSSIMEHEDTMPPVAAEPEPLTEPEPELIQQEPKGSLQNGVSPPSPGGGDSLLAPPSVASLLDISLPGPPDESLPPGEPHSHISDSIIELAINSAHYGDGSSLSPPKLNGSDRSKLLPSPSDSPAHSWLPSPTHDPQWYPSDSSDSTLGCLLSSLVSPDKTRRTVLPPVGPSSGTALLGPSLLDSNSHDSFQARGLPDVVEVDTQLACMMSESSVDYIARFNDLAHELAVSEPSLPPPGV
uniref:Protein cramped-like n=1 Tax=Astyanax mexicanus TaxID=7994 RepID=A0A8B9LPW1_ASTMX